jgi:hypothetical protein
MDQKRSQKRERKNPAPLMMIAEKKSGFSCTAVCCCFLPDDVIEIQGNVQNIRGLELAVSSSGC